eukprot:XP_011679769.1 PREDICTED: uncharacterized protein LOC105445662 [Strongylocentrotus purpuratus]
MAVMAHIVTPDYIQEMRKDGTWGGEPEIIACANKYRVNINVITSAEGSTEAGFIMHKYKATGEEANAELMTLYFGHVFEQHYVSLEPVEASSTLNTTSETTETPSSSSARNPSENHPSKKKFHQSSLMDLFLSQRRGSNQGCKPDAPHVSLDNDEGTSERPNAEEDDNAVSTQPDHEEYKPGSPDTPCVSLDDDDDEAEDDNAVSTQPDHEEYRPGSPDTPCVSLDDDDDEAEDDNAVSTQPDHEEYRPGSPDTPCVSLDDDDDEAEDDNAVSTQPDHEEYKPGSPDTPCVSLDDDDDEAEDDNAVSHEERSNNEESHVRDTINVGQVPVPTSDNNAFNRFPNDPKHFSGTDTRKIMTQHGANHPRLEKFKEAKRKLSKEVQDIQLKRLVDTRWSCRIESVRAVKATYPAILDTLEDIEESEGKPTEAAEARGLINALSKVDFLLLMNMWEELLSTTDSLSKYLQSSKIDLISAGGVITATSEAIGKNRTEEHFEELYRKARVEAEKQEIDPDLTTVRKRKRKVLSGEQAEDQPINDPVSRFRVEVFYKVYDSVLQQFKDRFSDFMETVRDFSALMPEHFNDLNAERRVKKLAEKYKDVVDTEQLMAEYRTFRPLVQNTDVFDNNDIYVKTINGLLKFLIKNSLETGNPSQTCEMSITSPIATNQAMTPDSCALLPVHTG